MSILIVDDCSITVKIVNFNLQKRNYKTLVAHSALEAIDQLRKVPDIQLMVLDIMMPEMNGIELFAKMREIPEWRNIPVIMCTAIADAETVKKAIRLGCKYYHIKPINPPVLVKQISDVLSKEEPLLYTEDQLIAQFGLDADSAVEIIKEFYKALKNTIAILESQITKGFAKLEASDMQKFSESASIIGARRVSEILDRVRVFQQTEEIEIETLFLEYRALLRELKILEKAIPLI
jgi:CheY-like chemotaxis protein